MLATSLATVDPTPPSPTMATLRHRVLAEALVGKYGDVAQVHCACDRRLPGGSALIGAQDANSPRTMDANLAQWLTWLRIQMCERRPRYHRHRR